MYEPLRGKMKNIPEGTNIIEPNENFSHCYSDMEYFDKEDVKSAVKFYEIYGIGKVADPWNTLRKDYKNLMQICCDSIKANHGDVTYGSQVWTGYYRKWLYSYCFGDVIE